MRFVCLVLCGLLLAGCASAEVFETVADIPAEPVIAPQMQIRVELPQDAAVCVMDDGEGAKMFLCDGYSLWIQTLPGGDLDRTVRTVSGFDRQGLQILERQDGQDRRYEWVWSSAGEAGDQLCRAVVLDDGEHHYCMAAMTAAEDAASLRDELDQVFASFGVE